MVNRQAGGTHRILSEYLRNITHHHSILQKLKVSEQLDCYSPQVRRCSIEIRNHIFGSTFLHQYDGALPILSHPKILSEGVSMEESMHAYAFPNGRWVLIIVKDSDTQKA